MYISKIAVFTYGTILSRRLNIKDEVIVIKSLSIPGVTNSFNIINWKLAAIKKLNTEVKKLITCHRLYRIT